MILNNTIDIYPDILFASGAIKDYSGEDYIAEHVLCHIVSGEMRVVEASGQIVFRAGETILMRRNLFVKCEKRAVASGLLYQVIFIVLKKNFLQQYALNHTSTRGGAKSMVPKTILLVKDTPAVQGLFNSLKPFLESDTFPGDALVKLKLSEAVVSLIEQDEHHAGWLFDTSVPGKLDLEDFMQSNFKFNVPMVKFAELSGRSLSTFQRDFLKIFGVPATNWLLNRRLEAAYEALLVAGTKSSDIYLEVGFEDAAHFSRSFKKKYGYSPSKIHQM